MEKNIKVIIKIKTETLRTERKLVVKAWPMQADFRSLEPGGGDGPCNSSLSRDGSCLEQSG